MSFIKSHELEKGAFVCVLKCIGFLQEVFFFVIVVMWWIFIDNISQICSISKLGVPISLQIKWLQASVIFP